MDISHRTVAKFSRYALLSIAGSVCIQMAKMWPPMWVIIVIASSLAGAYLMVFVMRYRGIYKAKRWANRQQIEQQDAGFLDFLTFISFPLIGAVSTCLIYWM